MNVTSLKKPTVRNSAISTQTDITPKQNNTQTTFNDSPTTATITNLTLYGSRSEENLDRNRVRPIIKSLVENRQDKLPTRYAKSAAPGIVGVTPIFSSRRSTAYQDSGNERVDELVSDSNLALYKYLLQSEDSSNRAKSSNYNNNFSSHRTRINQLRPSVVRNRTKRFKYSAKHRKFLALE